MSYVRLLLYCLILSLPLCAQRADTIFAFPLDGVTSAPTYSAPIRNIGQSGHILWVELSGALCATPAAVDIGLEASFNGTVWSPVGTPITVVESDINGNNVATTTAQGAFPYVRAAVRALAANCTASVRYSGTVGGQGIVSLSGGETVVPAYSARAPYAISLDIQPFMTGCTDVMNITSEVGRLDFVGVTATNNVFLFPSASLSIVLNIDGGSDFAVLPAFINQGSNWAVYMQAMKSGPTATAGTGVGYIPAEVYYQNSLRVKVCVSETLGPTSAGNIAIVARRSVKVQ